MLSWWSRAPPLDEDEDDEALDVALPAAAQLAQDATARHSAALGRSAGEERRRMERELVLRFDSRELKRGEAWFLVETAWLDAWMVYVLSEDDPESPPQRPGPLTNVSLFDPKEYCLRKGLVATTHYRGVNPQVYALYAELYGTAGAKPIVRWTLDIYATPVLIDDVHEMLHEPELKARVEVAALNDRFDEYARPPVRRDDESLAYRWFCRCEYLVPCLNRVLGGGPTYKAEDDASMWTRCCKSKKSRRRKGKGKKRRRRRSYDYDEEEEEDDTDDSQEETETRGLLA